jgi:ABC-2 type transport system permease protein
VKLAVRQTLALTLRFLRALWRQPWFVAITLVQPIIWLLLFGAMFKKVVEIPGFQGGSYIEFLTPGIVVMSALFSAGWHGMGLINMLERGILDRFLVSPMRRGSLIAAGVLQNIVVITIQSLVIIGLAFAVGARFSASSVLMQLTLAALLGGGVTALSDALALVTRQEESLIGAVQFIVLPATFLSTGMMAMNLLPGWIQGIARFNPVNWAVTASRAAGTDWALVGTRVALLSGLLVLCTALASRAFRVYQRAV